MVFVEVILVKSMICNLLNGLGLQLIFVKHFSAGDEIGFCFAACILSVNFLQMYLSVVLYLSFVVLYEDYRRQRHPRVTIQHCCIAVTSWSYRSQRTLCPCMTSVHANFIGETVDYFFVTVKTCRRMVVVAQ